MSKQWQLGVSCGLTTLGRPLGKEVLPIAEQGTGRCQSASGAPGWEQHSARILSVGGSGERMGREPDRRATVVWQ